MSTYYWIANWNLSAAQARLLLKDPSVLMIDGTTGSAGDCLSSSIDRIAGYITGAGIAWTPEQIAAARKAPHAFLAIDQSDADNELLGDVLLVKDNEPGASTPAVSAKVARQRHDAGKDLTIYVDQSGLVAVEDAIAAEGLPHGTIVGYQYASPTAKPDSIVPGTGRTLREANVDLSVVLKSWFPIAAPEPPKHAAGTFTAKVQAHADGSFEIHGTPHIGAHKGGPNEWHDFAGSVNKRTGEWHIHKVTA